MPKFAQIVHFDQSDLPLYDPVAPAGEWAVSGSFAFVNGAPADEKGRNAFEKGWLGVGSFGRATAAMVTEIPPVELGVLRQKLAAYVQRAGYVETPADALALADQEITFMQDLCAGLEPGTVVLVHRTDTPEGVHEECRAVKPRKATVH